MKSMTGRARCILSLSVIFSLLLAFTACKKNQPPPQASAKGSLVTDGGNCYPSTVHGSYYNGVPATDSDFVEVQVHVTSPGAYKITTDQQKGVSFSASGVFSDTGVTAVHLRSTGVFTEHTYADFTTSFDSSHCQFRVTIHDSAVLSIADNTWEFTAGGHFYHGPVSGFYVLLPGGDDPLTYNGSMQGFSDTSLTVYLAFSVFDTIPMCSRLTSGYHIFDFATSRFSTDSLVHYRADQGTAARGAVIEFTLCSEVVRFSGAALDANGAVVPITNGRIRCSNPRQEYFP